ncbi:hypothetical protein J5N97_005973 [Dioscorea zingiberensis]|uniref:Ferritin n=1 Tax=Dioscorea zingiberensis TaxID=325984 RepID=A0A9D5HTK8_9LILI|nr:hypothetical protein J5N97_005973 [Dioscorea zingiberensis]
MLLRASASLSLPYHAADGAFAAPAASLGSALRMPKGAAKGKAVSFVPMAVSGANSRPIAGVVFEPFEELKKESSLLIPSMPDQSIARQKYSDECEAAVNDQIKWVRDLIFLSSTMFHMSIMQCMHYFDRDNVALRGLAKFFKESSEEESSLLIPSMPDQSIARQKYSDECEAAVNDQINVEYNVSYVYHAMYAYFDRDNVALRGLAKFFKESSEEEREHAEKLMEYQNKRGGRVKLQSILMPLTEFDHPEKGDALNAMELALSLEKLTNEKLLNLHNVACHCNDVQLADYVESEFLGEQVEAIKKISEYVAQLRRVGKGHGTWHFDQMLLHEGAAA